MAPTVSTFRRLNRFPWHFIRCISSVCVPDIDVAALWPPPTAVNKFSGGKNQAGVRSPLSRRVHAALFGRQSDQLMTISGPRLDVKYQFRRVYRGIPHGSGLSFAR